MNVTFIMPRTEEGERRETVNMPTVPRVGEYVEHYPLGISGTVKEVAYFWWGDGVRLETQVLLK